MNQTEPALLTVRSPADLVAAVPYLLGFHPADSLVVVALRGRQIVFAARSDLPAPQSDPHRPARHLAEVLGRQGAEAATVLGYGPPAQVTVAVDAFRKALAETGMALLDALRVAEGRYWSYLCTEPDCCPAEGTPCDPRGSAVSAAAVFAGQVALPDRAALTAQVAPVGGAARVALGRATEEAAVRLGRLLTAARPTPTPGRDPDPAGSRPGETGALRAAGRTALRAALRRQRRGQRLADEEVAWLTLLLTHLPVRDQAWERTDGREGDIALWTDVFRRAEPELTAAPGSLLAFAAWRAGQGALAAVTLERVLAEHPDYSLAQLLDDLLRRGVPPGELDGWPAVGSPITAGVLRSRRRRPHRR